MTQAQHDDPFGEIRTQTMQALAVAATVGEAAARWAAVGIQNRTARTERDTTTDTTDRAADQVANQAQQHQDRHLIDQGLTDWLHHATLEETVRLWRTATIYAAAGNARAAHAATRAQQRLRLINQPLMDAYQRHRATGMEQAEAMRAAAYDLWQTEARTRANPTQTARPHGGRQPEPLPAGAAGRALPEGGPALDDLETAVRVEVGRLAAHISPEALDRLQRQWRADGRAPAADAAGLLAQFAREATATGAMPPQAADGLISALQAQADTERRNATLDSATRDDPATPGIDEHHTGQTVAGVRTDRANTDLAAAAHQQKILMSQSFPPLTTVARAPSHVAAKQPANTATQRRTRTP